MKRPYKVVSVPSGCSRPDSVGYPPRAAGVVCRQLPGTMPYLKGCQLDYNMYAAVMSSLQVPSFRQTV